ncbi:hypothetical protein [Methyloterricola oryzae]|uniref:hypothetical protein n=1 Tax=Methyloterricola oryzae TaxID=1495050 RepID=UPI0005EBC74D|nr:hypothetical protein [Methyloterricola oryzae]
MALPRLLFCVLLILVVGGCSSVRQTMKSWLHESPPTDSEAPQTSGGQIYYASSAGLAVHSEASASSKTIGRLDQYERVIRTRLERGFAFISSQSGAVQGWVDNAQLIWRVPTRKPAPQPDSKAAAPSPGPEPVKAEEPAASPPPAPVVTETAPPPAATPAPVEPAATPEPAAVVPVSEPPPTASPAKPAKARPEMFNPF